MRRLEPGRRGQLSPQITRLTHLGKAWKLPEPHLPCLQSGSSNIFTSCKASANISGFIIQTQRTVLDSNHVTSLRKEGEVEGGPTVCERSDVRLLSLISDVFRHFRSLALVPLG